jgi:uridylate kinase|tara:strand:- start:3235 stop:4008 length:774 start_codon:yes stop_codon:yes gene_type:complete
MGGISTLQPQLSVGIEREGVYLGSMATVVLALGGSLLRPEVEERQDWLARMVTIVRDRVNAGDRLGIVVGGGAPAREGIEIASQIIGDVAHLDRIGIAATRLNATIVREALADEGVPVSAAIPGSVDEAVVELSSVEVVVMGGTVPGHTTDAVAIRLAVKSGAEKCIIATNVAKVHSEDPRINPNAESFDRLTLSELQSIMGPPEHAGAGGSQVVDPVGVGVAVSSSMPLDILDGREPDRIKLSLEGSAFEGTVVEA